jgi:hypothetical protein
MGLNSCALKFVVIFVKIALVIVRKKYMLLGAMENRCSKSIRALEALRFVMWEYVMLLGSYTWT